MKQNQNELHRMAECAIDQTVFSVVMSLFNIACVLICFFTKSVFAVLGATVSVMILEYLLITTATSLYKKKLDKYDFPFAQGYKE